MSATVHLPHLALHRRREGYFTRLRVRVRRADLDRRIAAGEDPRADRDLARRAEELIDRDTRGRLAMVLDRVVAEALGPPAPFSSKVPLARTAIEACTPSLRAIVGRLESDRTVAAQGVAQVSELLRDGWSPLYSTATDEDVLRHRLEQIAAALEVRSHFSPDSGENCERAGGAPPLGVA